MRYGRKNWRLGQLVETALVPDSAEGLALVQQGSSRSQMFVDDFREVCYQTDNWKIIEYSLRNPNCSLRIKSASNGDVRVKRSRSNTFERTGREIWGDSFLKA